MHALRRSPVLLGLLGLLTLSSCLTGCLPATPRVVRIGLVAPFEGRYREIGTDVIPAARLAIRETAAQAGPGDLAVELVAYDDSGDPALAVQQARRLAADPLVVVVVGHWLPATSIAARPVYETAGIPMIQIGGVDDQLLQQFAAELAASWGGTDLYAGSTSLESALAAVSGSAGSPDILVGSPLFALGQFQQLAPDQAARTVAVSRAGYPAAWDALNPGFRPGYREASLGMEPGIYAVQAYLAVGEALQLIGIGDETGGADVAPDPVVYVYGWQDGSRVLLCSALRAQDCALP